MTNNQTRNKTVATRLCSICHHQQSDACNYCNSFDHHECSGEGFLSLTDEEAATLMGMTYSEYMEYCMDDNEEYYE